MIKTLTLRRFLKTDEGTLGVFIFDYKPVCVCLERPWHDNKINISCIPAGVYPAKVATRAKGQEAIRVQRVPGRTKIWIHSGNWVTDSKGCPLTGLHFGTPQGKFRTYSSRVALSSLCNVVRKLTHFNLFVEDCHG